ncbi:MAG: hypothetical protein AB2L14_18545 [Candidatus Xenobiia bacterium LiM19]
MTGKRRGSRGFSLALTLIVITLVFIIGFGIIAIVTSQSRTTTNIMQSTKAYYMARTGVDRAMAELRNDVFWTGCGSTSSPETISMNGFTGSYFVTVLAKSTNPTSAIKVWQITSTGVCDGAKRVLNAWITTESFAVYSYFTDYEGYGVWTSNNTFEGPVHTNGVFTFSGHPQFKSRTTCANVNAYDGLKNKDHKKNKNGNLTAWNLNKTNQKYLFTHEKDESKWFEITDATLSHFYCPYNSTSSNYNTWTDGPVAFAGSTDFSFKCGQQEIKLPIDTSGIKDVADISINPTGNSNNKYYMQCYMDSGQCKYVIRSNTASGTKVTPNPDPVLPSDATVHVNGKLYMQESTIAGKVTIASSNEMYLNDNIFINNSTVDMVGLVSQKNITVNSTDNITIHASILAIEGAFKASDYTFSPKKDMYLYGGNIAKSSGYFGSISGNNTYGFTEHYIFDNRFLNQCPKNFPITGKMKIIGIQDNASLK